MSGALIGPLLALGALAAGLYAFMRLPPRRALAAMVFAIAAALAMLRQVALAAPLAIVAVHLWQRAGTGRPSPGRYSEARSRWLAMTLDHDTGRMAGEVLAGPFAGRRLSDLSAAEMQALAEAIAAEGDEESLALLHAWRDRHGGPHGGPEAAPPPPAASGAMSEAEALRILGLEPGATLDEIRAAHRRLLKRVHPDLGGSDALAAMIIAAKERLDP